MRTYSTPLALSVALLLSALAGPSHAADPPGCGCRCIGKMLDEFDKKLDDISDVEAPPKPTPPKIAPGSTAGLRKAIPPKKAPAGAPAADVLSVERHDGVYRVRSPGSKDVVDVPTSADVNRQVVERARASAAGGKPLRLELSGFDADQARGLVRNAEIRAKADVFGVVHTGPRSAAQRLLRTECDFSQWKIVEQEHRIGHDGRSILSMTVDVPLKSNSKSSIRMTIEFLFKELVSSPVFEATRAEILAVLRKLFNRSALVEDGAVPLHREIGKSVQASGDPQIRFTGQGGDVLLVQKDTPRGRERARALG